MEIIHGTIPSLGAVERLRNWGVACIFTISHLWGFTNAMKFAVRPSVKKLERTASEMLTLRR
jgi:hypothetical protein